MTTTFEEELKRTGKIIYPNVGDSMQPLIKQGRDVMVIERPKGWDTLENQGSATLKCKWLDIPLYKRDSGQYVLHRVMKVRKEDYILCGDNRVYLEEGISDRHIIGVMTGVIRNGKEISVKSLSYRLYSLCVFVLFPLRYLKRVMRKIQKLIGRKHDKK